MKERTLLKQLQRKNEKALEEIMKKYGAYVTTISKEILAGKGTKEDVEAFVRENTKAIYVETPTNPMMNVVELSGKGAVQVQQDMLRMVLETTRDGSDAAAARSAALDQ